MTNKFTPIMRIAAWQTEDFYVSPEVYDAVQIGDIFDYDKQRLEE